MKYERTSDNCELIYFNESTTKLIANGWLGNEQMVRIYTLDGATAEIRVFNKDGTNYRLFRSKDPMDNMKIDKIERFLDENR